MMTWCAQLRFVIWLTISAQNTFTDRVKGGFFINDSLIVIADNENENTVEKSKMKMTIVLSYNKSAKVSLIKLENILYL